MNLYAFICLLYVIVGTNEAAYCPEGYELLGDDTNEGCYKMVDVEMEWNLARENCTRDGRHYLVSLEERKEAQILSGKITGRWTSAHYTTDHGWKWYNQGRTDLRAWGWHNRTANFPLYCATVGINKWLSNLPCSRRKPFICEAKPGCRIALFQETYPNLTLKNGHEEDVTYRGTIHVSCNQERGWRGEGTARCRGANIWTVPTCTKIQCSLPSRIDHQVEDSSSENKTKYNKGREYQYTCKTGYELNSDVILPRCTVNETWSDTNAECQLVSCEVPHITNGGHNRRNGVTFGETVTFHCNDGYRLLGEGSARCLQDSRLFPNIPSCEAVTCSDLEPLENGRITTQNSSRISVLFSCDGDFYLEGNSILHCAWSDEFQRGVLDGEQPACKRASCPLLPGIPNGAFSGDVRSGGMIRISCNLGYHVVGPEAITCFRGNWSTSSYPTCEANTCPMLVVGEKVVIEDGTNQTQYVYRDVVHFSCIEGYEPDGGEHAECNANGQWTSRPPTCQPKPCPSLPALSHGTKYVTALHFGGRAMFRCDPGYVLEGSATSLCQPDGSWSNVLPTCKARLCPALQTPRHGSKDITTWQFGGRATFHCNPGYVIDRSKTSDCLPDGTWSNGPPTCIAKRCPALPTPRHGSKDVTALHYGGRASFLCNPGYIRIGSTSVHCLQDGRWSSAPPICRACPVGTYRTRNGPQTSCIDCPVRSTTKTSASRSIRHCKCEEGTEGPPGGPCIGRECVTLTSPERGRKRCSHDSQGVEQCTFSCVTGYEIQGSEVRECTRQGWSGRPAVCVDVNECALENGHCSQGCVNTRGGYECTCTIPGYILAEDGHTCIQNRTCPVLEDRPGHGYLRCQTFEEENSRLCFIGCEPGYFFVSGQNNYLTCGPTTEFIWSHKRTNNRAVLPSCTRKFHVDTAVPISVTLNNAEEVCQRLSGQELTEHMESHLRSVMDDMNQGTCRGDNGGLCDLKKFTVSCDEEQKEIKMEFDLVVRNYENNPINVSNESHNNLREMLKRTMMMNNTLSVTLSREFTIDIGGREITLSPSNPVFGRLNPMCAEPGRAFTRERLCVPCDRGYYLPNPLMRHCVPCPRGYFQTSQGQISCDKCHVGSTTAGEGSNHPRMCNIRV